MIKGKLRLNWFEAKELSKMGLTVGDFKDIEPFYDACEEVLLEQGFELWDGDIIYEGTDAKGGVTRKKYNCAVVSGTEREGKFIVKELGIAYYHIKTSKVTDLDKLVFALNHTAYFNDGSGQPQEDSIKAKKYLQAYIDKMRELDITNIKQLLK